MNAYDIIKKKRDGGELSKEEIEFLVKGIANGNVPDYQIAAWAMAVYFQGMNERETTDLTLAMAHSGDTVDLSKVQGIPVDKHSTGGVGDKTTLVAVPLTAAAGVPVPKMSGRGLGHTGGTIDKLESIPGFKVEIDVAEFVQQVNRVKAAVISQSGNLVPADKKLYAIRDVTATVDSIPLIASSVMSKKLAAGARGIVLDVKVGKGAFMKDLDQAFQLARLMVDIGFKAGREVVAVLSDMDQPLGCAVGNALEIEEVVKTLKGEGAPDLTELSVTLASYMLLVGGRVGDFASARELVQKNLTSGAGFEKFREMVIAQGGDARCLDRPQDYFRASLQVSVPSPSDGYVTDIDAEQVGLATMRLGAGRERAGERIDHSVGVVLRRKKGDSVRAGQALAIIHANDPYRLETARAMLAQAYRLDQQPPPKRPLILGVVTQDEVIRYV
ncbi:MAG TPA: pyrimidine-nucleoside phosphorylase [Syntrophothermus lipocalidus]|nr:pyrimidine-nucleoside phosphorylase [Syntrophothermus lipocalidus]